MDIQLSPSPGVYNSGNSLDITITKNSDVELYTYTSNGISPILAKYIAYDNLSPQNPFIATVEDGLGNILLDGGFPKWYNDFCNPSWSSYEELSPSYKYLYDAIDFISNKTKVSSGNKKILVLGDVDNHPVQNYYSIKDNASGRGGFGLSIDTVCRIKGYTPTYKTPADYGGLLNANYEEINQYCCVLYFSTFYTNQKIISDLCIQSLISFRENGNGIFIITDHGDRELNSIDEANDPNYYGFYRNANYLVVNFGCYFSGNYDRTPVNVGFLRANYGNHILWKNLADTDYIFAGPSESKVKVTEYPFYTGSSSINIGSTNYITIKFLIKKLDGTLKSESYTYGLNLSEIVNFLDINNNPITENSKKTFLRKQPINFSIDYPYDLSGQIKLNVIPLGTFNFRKDTNTVNKSLYKGISNNLPINGTEVLKVEVLAPIAYSKQFVWQFNMLTFNMRTNKIMKEFNDLEFKNTSTTSEFRNLNKLFSTSLPSQHYIKKFIFKKIYNYFNNIEQPVLFDAGLNSPVVEALVYQNQDDLNYELANRIPPTPADIFNNWARFDGEDYYENKSVAAGNAAAWTFDPETSAVKMPLNVEPTNGFVSNLLYDNYEIETIVTSEDTDDDTIGLIAAFVRENNKNYYLCFTANMGGFEPQPQSGIGVYFNYIRSPEYIPLNFGEIPRYPTPEGWQNKTVKLKIKRENNIFKFWYSGINSSFLSTNPQFIIDLNSNPNLERFKGKTKYGFMTLSQPYSTYKDIKFTGGMENILVDIQNQALYNFDSNSQKWIKSDTDVVTKFGSGVLLYNPEQTDPAKKYLYKLETGKTTSYGPYIDLTSTSGVNFDRSLVISNSISILIKPISRKIRKIWLEFETDRQRVEIYSIDFTLNGSVITFPNPTIYNLNNAIILTEANEMYKLTEFGSSYILDTISSFKYINYN